jgi:hypothetical protein
MPVESSPLPPPPISLSAWRLFATYSLLDKEKKGTQSPFPADIGELEKSWSRIRNMTLYQGTRGKLRNGQMPLIQQFQDLGLRLLEYGVETADPRVCRMSSMVSSSMNNFVDILGLSFLVALTPYIGTQKIVSWLETGSNIISYIFL